MFNMSQIMIEAHAAAKRERAWVRQNEKSPKPYSYYLGLQMRSCFAAARRAAGVPVNGFTIQEPARWRA